MKLIYRRVCSNGRAAEVVGWENNIKEETCEQREVQREGFKVQQALGQFQTAKALACPEFHD